MTNHKCTWFMQYYLSSEMPLLKLQVSVCDSVFSVPLPKAKLPGPHASVGRQKIQHLMQQHQLMPKTYQCLCLFQHKKLFFCLKGEKCH